VTWADIPTTNPNPPYDPVDKACDAVWVLGVPGGGGDDVELSYLPDCVGENPGGGIYGWHWEGLSMTVEELGDLTDTSQCTTIQLCDEACNMLKNKEWQTITAKFGCGIQVIE